ncbi:MAG TPA: hypothetical protein VH720_12785 [Candidatus Limnocylindrales bacterium]
MERAHTRGQPTALDALGAMLRSSVPHALLLVGPPGVGKATLALDLAAALLCTAPDPAARPCRDCRGCRMVESGNHPDLHRLVPEGPGDQIRIGGVENPRGIRDLTGELALLPVEGGRRVAIIERAHRMNDLAQAALLKTLEEPPPETVIVLCADDEERLLPTIRSRAARIRLGPVSIRDIESLLSDLEATDPPTGARLARIASGRPGLALALARAPGVAATRGEIARSLLDLLGARPAERLSRIRELHAQALDAVRTLDRAIAPVEAAPQRPSDVAPESDGGGSDAENDGPGSGATRRIPAADRRRAAALVFEVWRDLTRDLIVAHDRRTPGHDPTMMDELAAAAAAVPVGAAGAFLGRLARAGELLELNIAPELLLDGLVLRWPLAGVRG